MKANATISINKARQLRWSRTLHAKLPTASAIAPVISTNSARSVAKKPNPIKGKTAIKSGIERQWIAHATERHAPVVSTNSWLKFLFNFISLSLNLCRSELCSRSYYPSVGASCARDLTVGASVFAWVFLVARDLTVGASCARDLTILL